MTNIHHVLLIISFSDQRSRLPQDTRLYHVSWIFSMLQPNTVNSLYIELGYNEITAYIEVNIFP